MKKEELYLKTVFCCVVCDGEIAEEEIGLIRELSEKDELFANIDTEKCINTWINEINEHGESFFQSYFNDLAVNNLNKQEQLIIVDYAIKSIEADNRIDYNEVKFFKSIRLRLAISDDEILAKHPDKEDFLLPDVNELKTYYWDETTQFANIVIPTNLADLDSSN